MLRQPLFRPEAACLKPSGLFRVWVAVFIGYPLCHGHLLRALSPLLGGHFIARFEFACEILTAGESDIHGNGGDQAGVGKFVAIIGKVRSSDAALPCHLIEGPFGLQHPGVAFEFL